MGELRRNMEEVLLLDCISEQLPLCLTFTRNVFFSVKLQKNTHNRKKQLPSRIVREFPRLWPQLRETIVCALKKPFKEESWWCSPGLSPHKQCLTLHWCCLSHINMFPLICVPVTPNEQIWVTSCPEEIRLSCSYPKSEKCLAFSARTLHLLQTQKQFHNWVSWNNFLLFYCCVLLMLLLSMFSLKLLPSFTGFFFLKTPLFPPPTTLTPLWKLPGNTSLGEVQLRCQHCGFQQYKLGLSSFLSLRWCWVLFESGFNLASSWLNSSLGRLLGIKWITY